MKNDSHETCEKFENGRNWKIERGKLKCNEDWKINRVISKRFFSSEEKLITYDESISIFLFTEEITLLKKTLFFLKLVKLFLIYSMSKWI